MGASIFTSFDSYGIMTTVITKDQEWLKKEIEKGIDSFFETECEYLVELMTRYIYKQIYVSGCSLNSESPIDEPAKLQIVIDVPVPDDCIETIDGISRKSVYFNS